MGGGGINPVEGGGGGGTLSAGLGKTAPVAMAAGGDGDELCIEEPVEVSRSGTAEEEEDRGPPPPALPPPPQRPFGSSSGVLRRFFHLARRFWNQT